MTDTPYDRDLDEAAFALRDADRRWFIVYPSKTDGKWRVLMKPGENHVQVAELFSNVFGAVFRAQLDYLAGDIGDDEGSL